MIHSIFSVWTQILPHYIIIEGTTFLILILQKNNRAHTRMLLKIMKRKKNLKTEKAKIRIDIISFILPFNESLFHSIFIAN